MWLTAPICVAEYESQEPIGYSSDIPMLSLMPKKNMSTSVHPTLLTFNGLIEDWSHLLHTGSLLEAVPEAIFR